MLTGSEWEWPGQDAPNLNVKWGKTTPKPGDHNVVRNGRQDVKSISGFYPSLETGQLFRTALTAGIHTLPAVSCRDLPIFCADRTGERGYDSRMDVAKLPSQARSRSSRLDFQKEAGAPFSPAHLFSAEPPASLAGRPIGNADWSTPSFTTGG